MCAGLNGRKAKQERFDNSFICMFKQIYLLAPSSGPAHWPRE